MDLWPCQSIQENGWTDNKKRECFSREEVVYDLQLLLYPQNRSSHPHLLLLLCYLASNCYVPRSHSSEMGCVLSPFFDHSLYRSREIKVLFSYSNSKQSYALSLCILSYIFFVVSRSIHLLAFWVLFENAMSLVRAKALVIGLLETGRVQEWVVTEKLGDTLKTKLIVQVPSEHHVRFRDR